ncbi:uncharacterized protein LOC117573274 isoform X2 [Drosophila albomicans]|uniref:Uncharacterized protein LOC117573274 isoform X2 n=1 Tax=Drosophila albomicans TaxID=7291 RepID=A0A9C6T8E1_DROAB|nr:uncharacterized protein LOC117573274 isoform X2 [Drosophila albomicans]
MFYQFVIFVIMCIIIIIMPSYTKTKSNGDSLNAILLKCSDNIHEDKPCVPHLIINIVFAPNLNSDNVDKLLILDETYEPSTRQSLKIMSPYIIVVTRSDPIITYPLKSSSWTNSNNYNIKQPGQENIYVYGKIIENKSNYSEQSLRATKNENTKIENSNINDIGKKSSEFCDQSRIHPTPTDEEYSIFNLSIPHPFLTAKIRIFRKRKTIWWRIMPIILLNNLSGTYVNGNISALLTSHNDILDKKDPKFLENFKLLIPSSFIVNSDKLNGLRIYKSIFHQFLNNNTSKFLNLLNVQNELSRNNDRGFSSSPAKILSKCPDNKNALCLNVLDDQVPAFDIKIKMPFVENAAQQDALKVKISRIVTDATTKDALQIFVDVINKGIKAHEFLISINGCPLSETGASTTVTKILIPYISETITFLLPFVMGLKKNVKYNCDVIVKTNEMKNTELDPKRKTSSDSSVMIVSRRPMEIETHSRCFCVWNCRCHCIGKIETHSDINVCQIMSYETQKDAGLQLNCPLNDDYNDLCSLDSKNNNKNIQSSSLDPYKTIGALLILIMVLFLLAIYFCKCFKPRKEDLIVASTEWLCCAENNSIKCTRYGRAPSRSSQTAYSLNYHTQAVVAPSAKVSFCPSPEIIRKKSSQSDLLESALLTLARQQKELRKQSTKRE